MPRQGENAKLNEIFYKKGSQFQLEYYIKLFDNYQEVELMMDEKIVLIFKETMNDKINLSTFTRKLKKQKYIFEEGKLV